MRCADWADFLAYGGSGGSGVPTVPRGWALVSEEPPDPTTLARVVADGAHVVTIDGRACRDSGELFDTWAAALRFPGYFGRNWDAFRECLGDLVVTEHGGIGSDFRDRAGIDASGLLIVVESAGSLLVDASARELAAFASIVGETVRAVDAARLPSVPLRVLLVGRPDTRLLDVVPAEEAPEHRG